MLMIMFVFLLTFMTCVLMMFVLYWRIFALLQLVSSRVE